MGSNALAAAMHCTVFSSASVSSWGSVDARSPTACRIRPHTPAMATVMRGKGKKDTQDPATHPRDGCCDEGQRKKRHSHCLRGLLLRFALTSPPSFSSPSARLITYRWIPRAQPPKDVVAGACSRWRSRRTCTGSAVPAAWRCGRGRPRSSQDL